MFLLRKFQARQLRRLPELRRDILIGRVIRRDMPHICSFRSRPRHRFDKQLRLIANHRMPDHDESHLRIIRIQRRVHPPVQVKSKRGVDIFAIRVVARAVAFYL